MTQATPTACRDVTVLSVIAVVKVSYTDLVVGGERSDRGCESAAAAAVTVHSLL